MRRIRGNHQSSGSGSVPGRVSITGFKPMRLRVYSRASYVFRLRSLAVDDCFARPDDWPVLAWRLLRRLRGMFWRFDCRMLLRLSQQNWKAGRQLVRPLFLLLVGYLPRCRQRSACWGSTGAVKLRSRWHSEAMDSQDPGEKLPPASALCRCWAAQKPQDFQKQLRCSSRKTEQGMGGWVDPTLCCRHPSIGPSSSPPQQMILDTAVLQLSRPRVSRPRKQNSAVSKYDLVRR